MIKMKSKYPEKQTFPYKTDTLRSNNCFPLLWKICVECFFHLVLDFLTTNKWNSKASIFQQLHFYDSLTRRVQCYSCVMLHLLYCYDLKMLRLRFWSTVWYVCCEENEVKWICFFYFIFLHKCLWLGVKTKPTSHLSICVL